MPNISRRGFHPAPCLALTLALAVADQAAAATFTVTNLADAGSGSLRQAVLDANAAAGADDVVFAPGLSSVIVLASGEIAITDPLVINGPGAGVLTVSGATQSRIFHVDNGAAGAIDVTLSGLTLTEGYAQGPGGAVLAADENLTIRNSVIADSRSEQPSVPETGCSGGNIASPSFSGTLRIEFSTVTGGVATAPDGSSRGGNICAMNLIMERSTVSYGSADYGGGLYGLGSIHRSTISYNTATRGGGIAGNPILEASTVEGNSATDLGGGLYLFYLSFEAAAINSTISGNMAREGAGIYVWGGGEGTPLSVVVRLTTIVYNAATERGGSIGRMGFTFTDVFIDHSILANSLPEDLEAAKFDFQFEITNSLIETVTGPVLVPHNNILGVDPLLGPLADNGGPTPTYGPLPGSPVIDAGDPAIGSNQNFPPPPATDQRGFARIVGPAVDLGSVEIGGIVEVPALSQIGLLVLSALLLAIGVWRLRLSKVHDHGR